MSKETPIGFGTYQADDGTYGVVVRLAGIEVSMNAQEARHIATHLFACAEIADTESLITEVFGDDTAGDDAADKLITLLRNGRAKQAAAEGTLDSTALKELFPTPPRKDVSCA